MSLKKKERKKTLHEFKFSGESKECKNSKVVDKSRNSEKGVPVN